MTPKEIVTDFESLNKNVNKLKLLENVFSTYLLVSNK